MGNTAVISTTNGGPEVTELTGAPLMDIGKNILLYIDPRTDTSLSLKLQLYYKGKPQGIPLRLDWGSAQKTNYLESLREQATNLLREEDLQEAADLFTIAASSYTSGDEKNH